MDVQDRANNPSMQDELHHSQPPGLAIGNRMRTRSQVVREAKVPKLWALKESRQGEAPNSLSTKYERCELGL